MKNRTLPPTIAKWAAKNQNRIDEIEMEFDESGEEHEGPWSAWCYLEPGYMCEIMGTHIIHESTVRMFMDATKHIIPCDCDDCERAMKEAA
mgnify:CR=1 FL=1|jgi:hypothetical protein|tara:strand:+ start:252 stop:524 length:273 start_codon:yes stop_codon:yes gene_type:complete